MVRDLHLSLKDAEWRRIVAPMNDHCQELLKIESAIISMEFPADAGGMRAYEDSQIILAGVAEVRVKLEKFVEQHEPGEE